MASQRHKLEVLGQDFMKKVQPVLESAPKTASVVEVVENVPNEDVEESEEGVDG